MFPSGKKAAGAHQSSGRAGAGACADGAGVPNSQLGQGRRGWRNQKVPTAVRPELQAGEHSVFILR